MKVQYCSDLHLEFPENRKRLSKYPLLPAGDLLLLAGDIVCFRDLEKARTFFDFVSDHYSEVFWVPGNHEYYESDISEKQDPLWENIRPNVHLVNNRILDRGGFRFIFSTLWGRIGPLREWDIEKSISDFSAIACEGRRFTARDFNALHEKSLEFLTEALRSLQSRMAVVITHHVPTLMNYPPAYRNSPLNEAFAVELFNLIDGHGPRWWIYGHHHVNTPAFTIGRTTMLTNQLGYVHLHEHRTFRRDSTIPGIQ